MDTAQPGDRMIYFVSSPKDHISSHRAVRETAMDLSDQGKVFLTQRRLGDDHYEYRATRRRNRQ
jgi:hypothetical protein